jgi:hypothetical protein
MADALNRKALNINDQTLSPCALSLIFALNAIAQSRTDGAP